MMTTHQLKAARALLDWTQQDLARAAGVHLNVVNNIERGSSSPRQNTLEKLESALISQGIVFIGARGVELARQAVSVRKAEGEGFIRTLLADILAVAKSPDDEVLSILADIRNYDAHDADTARAFYAEKDKRGFTERLITRAMPGFYPRHSEFFRVVDPARLGGADTIIYGNRVAFIMWQQQEAVMLQGDALATAQRRLFEALWETGQEPSRARRAAED